MGLRDTINALDKRAQEDAAFDASKPELIKRWQSDVQDLATQITEWLDDYVQTGALTVAPGWKDVEEEMLGIYSIRRLSIVAGPKRIEFVPVARMVVGSMGAVEMFTPPTARPDNSVVFRRQENGGIISWSLVGVSAGGGGRPVSALTREAFEEALDTLLKLR